MFNFNYVYTIENSSLIYCDIECMEGDIKMSTMVLQAYEYHFVDIDEKW